MNRFFSLMAIVAGLALAAFAFWLHGTQSSTSPKILTETDPLAPIMAAVRIGDPLERCLAYPTPRGYRWPRSAIEAFCLDEFTPSLAWNSMKDAIESGKAADIDSQLDAAIDAYLAGKLPEGALDHAYRDNFLQSSALLDRLIARWMEDVPGSAHALAARGMHELAAAWEVRGEDSVGNTPERDLASMTRSSDLAQGDLEKAIALNPRILPAYGALIHVARLRGRTSVADSSLQGALKLSPAAFYPRAERMVMYEPRWGGSFEQMDKFAADAMPYTANNPRMVNLKAMALAARGLPPHLAHDYKSSVPAFESGLAEGPVIFCLRIAQFDVVSLNDDRVRAVELLSQILRFAPNDLQSRSDRSHYLATLGREEWAVSDLEAVLRIDPRNAVALRGMANALITGNKDEPAEAKLKQLLAADPTDRWAKATLAWMYVRRTHKYDEANELIAQMLQKEPESGDLWLLRVKSLDAKPGPGMREAVEHFVRYADPNSKEQRDMLPVAQNWLLSHPAETNAR